MPLILTTCPTSFPEENGPSRPAATEPQDCQSSTPSPLSSHHNSPGMSDQIVDELTNDDLPIALRKTARPHMPYQMKDFVYYGNLSSNYRAYVSKMDQIRIPNSVQEKLKNPGWKAATYEEITALEKNDTWELTLLPPGKKTVGCRWLFTVKHNADGSVERLKARLVARGYTQTYGIDYQETFAPVAKQNTIRVLLFLAANSNWPLHQLDVKNAFLNGELSEEVYMDIPPGFEDQQTRGKVCKLKKSLYGLKQSPLAWFSRFSQVLKKFGYSQSQAYHTLFSKLSQDGRITILSVYVDDIVITGDNHEDIISLKKVLASEFEVKDLGNLKYFLGMEVSRSHKGISVSQRKYTLD